MGSALPKTAYITNQKKCATRTRSHLSVNAGFVRFGNGEQDLLHQAAAPPHDLLGLRVLNKCAPLRQRCAAGEGRHVAGNGENCKRRKITTSPSRRQNDPCCASSTKCVCVCVWQRGASRTKAWLSPQQLLRAAALDMPPLRLNSCTSSE